MIVNMDLRLAFLGCEVLFFIIPCVCTSELSPPSNVNVNLSVLTWNCPKDCSGVVYTVEYNTTLNNWGKEYSGLEQKFNFTANAEDFYGKRFRVRVEKESQTSDWVPSSLVQCAHLHTCAPVLELKVETDRVHLWMTHRDQSLKEKNGGHVLFRALYWKKSMNNEQVRIGQSSHIVLEDLEPLQEYCFQVDYLVFDKPFGRPSGLRCDVIPETSKQRNVRVVMIGLVTVSVLVLLGTCLYLVYTHHKRIKALLQPPLDIPEHFEEFVFSEFSPRPFILHASQEVSSFEVLSVDEVAEGRECDERTSSST